MFNLALMIHTFRFWFSYNIEVYHIPCHFCFCWDFYFCRPFAYV